MMLRTFRKAHVIARGLLASAEVVSRLDYRVGLIDCDINRHMTNSRYPDYLDLGRWHLMMRSGAYKPCLHDRSAPIVVELKVHYQRELRYGVEFTLDSRLISIEGKCMHFEPFFLVKGQPYCRAQVKSLLVQKGRVISADCLTPFIGPRLRID